MSSHGDGHVQNKGKADDGKHRQKRDADNLLVHRLHQLRPYTRVAHATSSMTKR